VNELLTVPVSLHGLGVEGGHNVEIFSQAVQQVPGQVHLVPNLQRPHRPTSMYMITDLEQLVASVMQISACMAVTTLECNGACRQVQSQMSHPNKCCVNVEQHNSYWLAIQH